MQYYVIQSPLIHQTQIPDTRFMNNHYIAESSVYYLVSPIELCSLNYTALIHMFVLLLQGQLHQELHLPIRTAFHLV
jgi:hypothetical protein